MLNHEMVIRSQRVIGRILDAMRELNAFGEFLALNNQPMAEKFQAFELLNKAYEIIDKTYQVPALEALNAENENLKK